MNSPSSTVRFCREDACDRLFEARVRRRGRRVILLPAILLGVLLQAWRIYASRLARAIGPKGQRARDGLAEDLVKEELRYGSASARWS